MVNLSHSLEHRDAFVDLVGIAFFKALWTKTEVMEMKGLMSSLWVEVSSWKYPGS